MSWAEVKKINSDMNKPLNELITEKNENYKIHYMTASAVGVPYNQNSEEKVITDETSPLISVTGKGKILSIFPIFVGTNASIGTSQVKIDGKEVIHKSILFGSENSTYCGSAILLSNKMVTYSSSTYTVCTDTFNELSKHYFLIKDGGTVNNILNESIFNKNTGPAYYKDGLYFYDGFEIKATQAYSSGIDKSFGIYVMYELFE